MTQEQGNILVTGGTGFIGCFLVAELVRQGWNVVVLSRQSSRVVKTLLGEELQSIQSLSQWPYKDAPEACINLAGEGILDKRWGYARKQVLRDSRIQLTKSLVEWLAGFPEPCRTLISGSAVGFYGVESGAEVCPEERGAGRDFAAQLCTGWEQAARTVSSETRLCLLRTGIVLHGKHGALKQMLPPFKLGLGGVIGSGDQMMPWIHIEDMVKGILFLLNADEASGAFNMVAPGLVSNRVFVKSLGQALHRPALFPMPACVLKVILGEGADLLLNGQNAQPNKLVQQGFRFTWPELPMALENVL